MPQIRFQLRLWPGRHAYRSRGDTVEAEAMSDFFVAGDKGNLLLVCGDPKAALRTIDRDDGEGKMSTWKYGLQSNRTYSLQLRYCIGKFTR